MIQIKKNSFILAKELVADLNLVHGSTVYFYCHKKTQEYCFTLDADLAWAHLGQSYTVQKPGRFEDTLEGRRKQTGPLAFLPEGHYKLKNNKQIDEQNHQTLVAFKPKVTVNLLDTQPSPKFPEVKGPSAKRYKIKETYQYTNDQELVAEFLATDFPGRVVTKAVAEAARKIGIELRPKQPLV